MSWLSKDEAISRFMVGTDAMAAMVNMPLLALLIHEALTLDGHDVEIARIWQEVIIPPMQEKGIDESLGDDERFQRATVVYLHYADWTAELGRLMDVDPDADIQPEWTKQNPHVGVVVNALAAIAVRVSLAASAAYEAQHGHSMLEVFLASTETGEDFDQSRARLTAQRRGLAPVK